MSPTKTYAFRSPGSKVEVESGLDFQPKFDADGLIPAIVTDARSGEVLMFAFMNAEALGLSMETGVAHFWSRSRAALWKKGDESGNVFKIVEMRTDCDQDVIWLRVTVEGDGHACHMGRRSCFYRLVPVNGAPGEVSHLTFAPDADDA
jgi:phosphoribosyl-AMP cyclohydrolase